MDEKQIFLDAQGVQIEGLLGGDCAGGAAVITHPHPLYGGDMYNPVVESVTRAFAEKGMATLRFNFRGVGRSQGRYDEGMGEQEDVKEAVAYLRELGAGSVDLAGYSFGAWVNARVLGSLKEVGRMIMVSPPVDFMDFSFLHHTPRLRLVIAGDQDDIGPAHRIKALIPHWNPECDFEIISGADHFYGGKTHVLEGVIEAFLNRDSAHKD
ncbi:MAG: alpha/beta hydrolase [Desulfobacteraceae bacterium]